MIPNAIEQPIDGDRLSHDIISLARITDPQLPYTHRCFSPLFLDGRRWLSGQFEAAELKVRIDAGGNLHRADGTEPTLKRAR